MSSYLPIFRGEYSSELKYTKDKNDPYVHTQFKCIFTDEYQKSVRSLFVFPVTDKRGVNYFKVRVLTAISKPSVRDSSKLVAPIDQRFVHLRVNLDTRTVTGTNLGRNYGIAESLDDSMPVDEFKSFLLYEVGLAKSLISLCE